MPDSVGLYLTLIARSLGWSRDISTLNAPLGPWILTFSVPGPAPLVSTLKFPWKSAKKDIRHSFQIIM